VQNGRGERLCPLLLIFSSVCSVFECAREEAVGGVCLPPLELVRSGNRHPPEPEQQNSEKQESRQGGEL